MKQGFSDLCLYFTAIDLRYMRSDDVLSTRIFGLCSESPSTKSTTAFLTAKVYSSFTSVATESANSEYFMSLFGISLKILRKIYFELKALIKAKLSFKSIHGI